MFDLAGMREAIRLENLGGWLFSTLKSRDVLSLSILGIGTEIKNSRPWYYFIFPEGPPLKIVHGIEAEVLDRLPGEKVLYSSRLELSKILRDTASNITKTQNLACQFSPELPIISFLDHGTALFLSESGFRLASSAGLIQRFRGLLDENGIASHNHAAVHLYEIVEVVWKRLCTHLMSQMEVHEGDVRDWMLSEFHSRGLITDSSPVAAAGANSGNPHYGPQGRGARIQTNQVVQLDLWAKEEQPGSIYADISWVGFTAHEVPAGIKRDLNVLTAVRDRAAAFISARIAEKSAVSGEDVDRHVRELLIAGGYENALRHRTGHGIDTECHGSGVNLDSIEFPDRRVILDGSCFSIEPGIYFPDFGLRTEINAYSADGRLIVSGKSPQREFLTFPAQ